MKLSNISTAPYRPQIKRLGQKDLPLSKCGSEFDCSSKLVCFHLLKEKSR